MRPRNHLISTKLAVLLIFGIAGGLFFARGGLTTEAQLTPTPSYHVDIGDIPPLDVAASTGNTFTQDPDSSGSGSGNGFSDQIMSVPPITSCVSKTVDFSPPLTFPKFLQRLVWTDIIIKNADEMAGADVRLNWDPSLITLNLELLTPFTGGIGLINLPEESGAHRTAAAGTNIDNVNGAAFLSSAYQGNREFDVSSESGPTVDGAVNSLPDRNAGQAPDGGVFVRIRWILTPASSGQDVRIDLSPGGAWRSGTGGGAISAGSEFLILTSEFPSASTQITSLTNADLFDGIISVNKAIPSSVPCPTPEPFHDLEATIDDAATVILDPDNGCMSTNETNAVGNGLYKIKIEEEIIPGSVEKPILVGLLIDAIPSSGASVNTTDSATGALAALGTGSQVVSVKDATVLSDGPVNADVDADLERLTVMETTGEATVELVINYEDPGCVDGGTPAAADGGDYTVTVDVCLQGDPAPLGLVIAGPGLPGDCGTFANGGAAHDTDPTNDTPPSITVDSLSY